MNRAERRRLNRDIGKEGEWKKEYSPKEKQVGAGWFGEMDRVYSNKKYSVMIRTVVTDWGVIEHAAIRNVSGTDIPWKEKQRIKNEIFGEEYTAIEVFPKESELVDEANMYHLWVFPSAIKLPFGL